MKPIRIAKFAEGKQTGEKTLFTGFGHHIRGKIAKKLIDFIFCIFILSIEFAINSKKVETYKNIENNLDFDSNF